jgi:cytochrome c553
MPATGTTRFRGSPACRSSTFAKQLFDYRDGSRPNPVMGPHRKALSDAEIGSLARYYASQEVPVRNTPPAAGPGRGPPTGALRRQHARDPGVWPTVTEATTRAAGRSLPPLAQPAAYYQRATPSFSRRRTPQRRRPGDARARETAIGRGHSALATITPEGNRCSAAKCERNSRLHQEELVQT